MARYSGVYGINHPLIFGQLSSFHRINNNFNSDQSKLINLKILNILKRKEQKFIFFASLVTYYGNLPL